MKKLLFVLLLTISSVVRADWRFVSQVDDEAKFYIETTTIQSINGNKRAWLKTEYSKKLGDVASSSRTYMEFDCKEIKSRRLSFEAFRDSNLVSSIEFDKKIGDWIYSPPKSVSVAILNYVCNRK
jgi:hypothetical protein